MKIAIIGAGKVGSTAAFLMAFKNLGDIILVDLVEGLPQGHALDLMEASPLLGFEHSVLGCNDFRCMAGAEIAVITAGVPRKPGMSRLDLLNTNKRIVEEVCRHIKKSAAKNCIVIVVTNPLDVLCMVAKKALGFPRQRLIGMSGLLDSSRMSYFIGKELGIPAKHVYSTVLGSHGDNMVPLTRHTRVGGKPVEKLLSKRKLAEIIEHTQQAGAEIVAHLKTGSAFFAPAAAITEMVEAIVKNKKKTLPCSAYLEGEYGLHGVFVGVPCVLGKKGLEKITELKLSSEELALLRKSAEETRKAVKETGI
ncbi:MAG: malate dehydrogenase [Candidatus Diapherotrites archaeon]|uniref:Malate dehydrogenase n=1 Tax=Candidatus Iainarchaeum sp. TaxID=3101447 RepID=A0A8T4L8D3_9ARCH|nr:malate dehydrogenase [Candidatus Diapherotrites archaeon]